MRLSSLPGLKKSRCAFTLVELLVVLAITSILSSMLLPSLSRAREMGRRTSCASNLRQLGMAVQMYVDDNDEMYPLRSSMMPMTDHDYPATEDCPATRMWPVWWGDEIYNYVKTPQVFRCPNSGHEQHIEIAMPYRGMVDHCPPSNGGGGGGGFPSCPPFKPDMYVKTYSYAINALSDDDIWWERSRGVGPGRSGFSGSDTNVDCSISKSIKSISSVGVDVPSETIYMADVEQRFPRGDVRRPEFVIDAQLPHADSEKDVVKTSIGDSKSGEFDERVAKRHSDGFNALFADGHVKWQHRTTPARAWTVQQD